MKKIIVFMLMGLLSFGIMFLIASCANDTFTVNYLTEGGGQIKGAATQTVRSGERTTEVEAIPQQGYYFVGWSDEQSSAVRHEEDVTSDQTFTAKFEKQTYHLSYLSDENGTIEGEENQALKYGDRSSSVRAVPNEGYRFVQWSDGETSATRRDTARTDKTMTAEFEEIRFHFRYDYGMATGNCSEEAIEISYLSFSKTNFIVPEREHFYFKGWYLGDLQISNELGDPIIEALDFSKYEMTIKAKWEPIETFTYKVLLVYVQEIHGTFTTINKSETIEVDYQMSEIEHKICELNTIQVTWKLNELMDGLVHFEVDEYFTKQPINYNAGAVTASDALHPSTDGGYVLDPSKLPETRDMMKSYGSTLITFCLNDYALKLRTANGYAWEERGGVYLENHLAPSIIDKKPIETLLDLRCYEWIKIIQVYLHEFIHTIELREGMQHVYHTVLKQFMNDGLKDYEWEGDEELARYMGQLYDEIDKSYLFNMARLNGEHVGIPYEFWKQL